MVHTLRAAYGWTDEEIYKGIREYGGDWIAEAYKLCIEDKVEEKQWLIQAMPLARTPQSSSGARALDSYVRRLQSHLKSMAPWIEEKRRAAIRKRLKEPPKSTIPIIIE